MAEHTPKHANDDRAIDSSTEESNVAGRTVASVALGHGMERVDMTAGDGAATPNDTSLPHATSDNPPSRPKAEERDDDGTNEAAATDGPASPKAKTETSGASKTPRHAQRRAQRNPTSSQPVHARPRGQQQRQGRPMLGDSASYVLARDEVAAVSMDRSFYVSDVPSPYLSSKQAHEDIGITKRRHSTIMIAVAVIVVALLIGVGIGFIWNTTHPKEQRAAAHYQTATIERGELLETIDTTALVKPIDERAVASTVSGNIKEVLAVEGAYVNAEDPLFLIDNPTITGALADAQAAFEQAQVTSAEKNQALDEANATVIALEAAVAAAPEDTAMQAALNSAIAKLEPAQTEADAATTTLHSLEETFNRAKEQEEALVVRSPISGNVNSLNTEVPPGTPISASVRLCMVSDTSRYCIDVEIPIELNDRVYAGQEVRLTFPSIPDLILSATVEYVRDESSIRVARIGISAPDERIAVGTAANASIILQSIPDSLLVPLEAIHIGEDGLTHIDVLIDSTRGIVTDVAVDVIATSPTQAAISAQNIQVGNAVIIPDDGSGATEDTGEEAAAEAVPAEEAAEQPAATEDVPAE